MDITFLAPLERSSGSATVFQHDSLWSLPPANEVWGKVIFSGWGSGGLCMMSLLVWLPGPLFLLGGVCPRGSLPGPMFLPWGSLSGGISVQWGSLSRGGSLFRGRFLSSGEVSVCGGGLCLGGLGLSRGFL